MTIDKLIEKIRNNDLETFSSDLDEYLKDPSHSINDKSSRGQILLVEAAAFNHLAIVKLLLQKKADIDAINTDGNTALIEAAATHHIEIMALLLHHKANPNIKNTFSVTALGWVIVKNNVTSENMIKAIQLLLDYGADINVKAAKTLYETTIIEYIVSFDIKPVAEYLLSQGVIISNVNIQRVKILCKPKRIITLSTLYTMLEDNNCLISLNKDFFIDPYCYTHNEKIKDKIYKSAFELGLQTPLLDTLGFIISQYLLSEPDLITFTFEQDFKAGRALRFSPTPVSIHTNHEKLETAKTETLNLENKK